MNSFFHGLARLVDGLRHLPALHSSAVVIEDHLLGFHSMGDPETVLLALLSIEGSTVWRVGGGGSTNLDSETFHHMEVACPDE